MAEVTSHTETEAGGARNWSQHYKQHLLDENARMRAALLEILAYQGTYATDKNPTIRAIKRIASGALAPVPDDDRIMPLLPNEYHPGERCSCAECLEKFT